MIKSATELMKMLKCIESDLEYIHSQDRNETSIKCDIDGEPIYESDYNFAFNREEAKQLYESESKIKLILAKFNVETKIIGYDMTIIEGLVRIAQLRNEIRVLTPMAAKTKYTTNYSGDYGNLYKVVYDVREVKETLKKMQQELSRLQVAIDKTNLNSKIEF